MCLVMHGKRVLGIMHELWLETAFMLIVQLIQNQTCRAASFFFIIKVVEEGGITKS